MPGIASMVLAGLVLLVVATMWFFRSLLETVQHELRSIRELMRAEADKRVEADRRAMNPQNPRFREDGKQFDAVQSAIARIDTRLNSILSTLGEIGDEVKRNGPREVGAGFLERSANKQKDTQWRRQEVDDQVPFDDEKKDGAAQLLACANSLLQDPESLDGIKKRLVSVSDQIDGEPRGESRPDYFLVKANSKVFVLPNGDRYTRIPSEWFNSADFRKATSKIESIVELPLVRPGRDGYVSERPGLFRVSD